MSINDGYEPKARQRQALEALMAQYDGPISRSNGSRVTIRCRACGARRHVALSYAVQFRADCVKCGGEGVVEP